jgi:hypothetical protein
MELDVGKVISGIWRPALYYQDQTLQATEQNEFSLRSNEQALRLLIERLDELLLYTEPSTNGLNSYGHKPRELLILACTEVENQWKQALTTAGATPSHQGFTTNEYVKLLPKLKLAEFAITIRPYKDLGSIRPFATWHASSPTKSLPWYEAYNKTKHDRTEHFKDATLLNCLHAVTANVVLFSARFGPFFLLDGQGALSSLVNQLFRIELHDPDYKSFYVPNLKFPSNIRQDLMTFESKGYYEPWKSIPLAL